MALLAEELVEEWLNRQEYFTIRGVKIGVDEIDLLAVRFDADGKPECRHIEVQASMRPISYISRIPKDLLQSGQSPTSAKTRSRDMLQSGVTEWVAKKFTKPKKVKALKSVFPSKWSSELVVNNVKSQTELSLIQEAGMTITQLSSIINELNQNKFSIQSAAGADFADLIHLASKNV